MVAKMTPFIEALNTLNGVTARTVWDSAGRDIARTEINFDEAVLGRSTYDIVRALKTGDIRHLLPRLQGQRRHYRGRRAQRRRATADDRL